MRQRISSVLMMVFLMGPILACIPLSSQGLVATYGDGRWACPSPMPLPYGENGPIKREYECNCQPDPLDPTRQICETCREYYEIWEQEYPHLGGPPFPSPTAYGFSGRTFVFGQRVEVAPLHVTVSAKAGPPVELAVREAQAQQLYHISLTWNNPTGTEIPVRYDAQLRLRAVTLANGAIRTDSGWGVTGTALEAAGVERLPDRIPVGESQVMVPILGPPGEPKIVELAFPGAGYPVATPPGATPTPNTELRRPELRFVTLQWSNSNFDFYGAPACGDAGATTDWDSGERPAAGVAAPPGSSRVIQVELNQVGKRYVWGAAGPETFDCSGLQMWSYAQIGISIPRTTATQWPGLRPVERDQLQPGDLAYMDTNEHVIGAVTHVGMMADVNADGAWDLIHAASPKLGVRVDYDVFNSTYYAHRFLGFRTVR